MKLNLFTKENSTVLVTDFEGMLESLFRKRSSKYDLYFYDNIFTPKFGKYLLPLDNYVPSEIFDLYKQGVANQTCRYKDQWIALVTIKIFIIFIKKNILMINIFTIIYKYNEK